MKRLILLAIMMAVLLALPLVAVYAEDEYEELLASSQFSADNQVSEGEELFSMSGEPLAEKAVSLEGDVLSGGFLSFEAYYEVRLPMIFTKP